MRSSIARVLSALASAPPYLLTGILLGVAFPSYMFIRLEPLAWIGLVPLLLELGHRGREEKFGAFYRKVYLSFLVWVLISVWWVSLSTLVGGSLMYFTEAFFLSVPLILFYFIRHRLGSRLALWSLPFVWTAWEWIYLDLEISFGWLTLGNSQSNLYWLIQYIDLTGVWGVSFWLVLFNVLVVMAIEDFYTRHSPEETLPNAVKNFSPLISSLSRIALWMLAFPALYSIYAFATVAEPEKKITVSLIQPNIDPWLKWSADNRMNILNTHFSISDSAVHAATSFGTPDLLIWPETAIPYFILHTPESESRDKLFSRVQAWQTPLLSGLPDIVFSSDESKRKASSRVSGKGSQEFYDTYNSSMLVTPGDSLTGGAPQVYHKMKLVPFAERVPYMDYIPYLSRLTLDVGGVTSWGTGEGVKNFSFTTRQGDSVSVCGLICYEQLYPGFTAEFVSRGASLIGIITNDAWFAKTYGPVQFAAFTRLRAIETRRSVARCANTGLSFFTDRFGRIYGDVPWWTPTVATSTVALSTVQTFYVRHIDLFPKVCLAVSILVLLVTVFISFTRKASLNFKSRTPPAPSLIEGVSSRNEGVN